MYYYILLIGFATVEWNKRRLFLFFHDFSGRRYKTSLKTGYENGKTEEVVELGKGE